MNERQKMQFRLALLKFQLNSAYGKNIHWEMKRSQAIFAEMRFIRFILQHIETQTIGM